MAVRVMFLLVLQLLMIVLCLVLLEALQLLFLSQRCTHGRHAIVVTSGRKAFVSRPSLYMHFATTPGPHHSKLEFINPVNTVRLRHEQMRV